MVAFMTVQEEGGLSLENATKDDPILIGSILGIRNDNKNKKKLSVGAKQWEIGKHANRQTDIR